MTNVRRTNLTISFDPDFITWMDSRRGDMSRGAWLERQSLDGVSASANPPTVVADAEPARGRAPVQEPPTPKATRSPKVEPMDKLASEPYDKYAPNAFQRATQKVHKDG